MSKLIKYTNHMHKDKTVIKQSMLVLPKIIQYLDAITKLLSKFHNFWSSFGTLLPFIYLHHACTKLGAKQTFHTSISYLSCRSTQEECNATEFVHFLFSMLFYDFPKFQPKYNIFTLDLGPIVRNYP